MKPAPFDYVAPDSLDEALALMAEHGYDAKLLAGGQSLIPMMNFRLAQPAMIVDLNRLVELDTMNQDEGAGALRLGAMVRQRQLERHPLVAEFAPLLYEAMPYVAHPQIRNRGTLGGSLAHADPAAELPVATVALSARFRLQRVEGERWIEAEDFFVGLFTTALAPEEILVEVALPAWSPRSGYAFMEIARRHGDYALAGVAALLSLDEQGRCSAARLVYLNAGETPVVASKAANLLVGEMPMPEVFTAVADTATQQEIEPMGDIHATAEFKRHLARVLTRRALQQAFERARNGS
jgi:carbon-monoxide dehydrogenase medium subunit